MPFGNDPYLVDLKANIFVQLNTRLVICPNLCRRGLNIQLFCGDERGQIGLIRIASLPEG